MPKSWEHVGDVFQELFVSDEKGTVFADGSGGKLRGTDISAQKYFMDAQKGTGADREVIRSEKDGQTLVPICVPLFSGQGAFAGTLTAFVVWNLFSEYLLSVRPGHTGYAFVADRKGIILIHPKKDLVLKLDITTLRGMQSIAPQMLNQ
ncbi:MAG: cache domain-containing protein [Desulfobacterales bacterium]